MKNLDFKCPSCLKQCPIEEVLVDANVCSTILEINEHGDVDYACYGNDIYDGQVDRFQCSRCGFTIRQDDSSENIVNNYEDLYSLAVRKGWVKE